MKDPQLDPRLYNQLQILHHVRSHVSFCFCTNLQGKVNLFYKITTVPVQSSKAHQALKVGLGVDVPLPHGMQLEA